MTWWCFPWDAHVKPSKKAKGVYLIFARAALALRSAFYEFEERDEQRATTCNKTIEDDTIFRSEASDFIEYSDLPNKRTGMVAEF